MNKQDLLTIPDLLAQLLHAWQPLLNKAYQNGMRFIRSLPLLQILYLLSCIALLISAAPHWISYEVSFVETRQFTIGSEMRIYFFGLGLVAIGLQIFKLPYQIQILYTLTSIISIVYICGWIWPNQIHTHMLQESDFGYNSSWIYLYGLSLLALLFTAYRSLQNPWLKFSMIRNWLEGIATLESKPIDTTTKNRNS